MWTNQRLNERADLQRFFIDRHLARLNAREVENVVDNVQQRLGRTHYQRQVFPLVWIQRRVQAELGHAEDPVHRGTDFVAHVGEERAFRLVGLLSDFRRLNGEKLSLFAPGNILQRADNAFGLLLHAEGHNLA